MNDRLQSAFANPAQLTDQDLADMTAAMKKDASTAAKRRNRLQTRAGQMAKKQPGTKRQGSVGPTFAS